MLEAVHSGEFIRDRIESYRKLSDGSGFYQMPHAEKRKKDRDFGRFIKSVKRDLKGEYSASTVIPAKTKFQCRLTFRLCRN